MVFANLAAGIVPGRAANTPPRFRNLQVHHLREVSGPANPRAPLRFQVWPEGRFEFTNAKSRKVVDHSTVLRNAPLVLTAKDFKPGAKMSVAANGVEMIHLELTAPARARFEHFTRRNVGATLAIVASGKIISVPTVISPIAEGKIAFPTEP